MVSPFEGTSLPCLLRSSLSLACRNVTLLSPHDNLILTASHKVCRGSFTGQCMENFFKIVFASLKFLLCASNVLNSVDTWWRPTPTYVNMYIRIDGKVKGAWHLNYLVKHSLAHLGFYIFQLFYLHLSLIIFLWLLAVLILTRMLWKLSKMRQRRW